MGLLSVVGVPARVEGRLLNLNGDVTLEYRLMTVENNGTNAETSTLRESVTAATGGEVFRQAIGRYQLGFTFANEDRRNDSSLAGGENTQTINFSGALNLLPRVMPVSLSAQRTTLAMEGTGGASTPTAETTVSIYNLGWEIPRIWKLPQLHLNLYYTTLETNSCTAGSPSSCDNTTRFFGGSLNASDQYPYRYIIKNTEINWTVFFSSQQLWGNDASNMNVGGRVIADSQWSPAVKSSLRVSYSTGLSSQNASVPGGIPTLITAGATLFYKPSLRLNSSLAYDYTRDVYDRHVGGGDVFYRPSPQLDVTGAVRGSFTDLHSVRVVSAYGSGMIVYRPILNLTANFSGTLGVTQTQADAVILPKFIPATNTNTLFQDYGASVSYFKLYELVRVNTSAGLGVSDVMSTGSNSATFTGHWLAQATNTKTQYVTVTGAYTGNFQELTTGGSNSLWSNALRFDASTMYFKELLLRGDVLMLHTFAGDQMTTGIGHTQMVDVGADGRYGWRALGFGSGYATHISTNPGEDYDDYFFDFSWTAPPLLRNLYLALHGRYDLQMYNDPGRTDSTMALADVNSTYRFGLVEFNLQYQLNYIDQGGSTLSHSVNLRLTRRFSI
jgi:hypothetical protein